MAKTKRGLGQGMSALFGEEEELPVEGGEVTTLPLSRIEPRQDQPRQEFDEEALEALADSIREYGLIQPITVRPLDRGYYQIIAGERRWRASRKAGLKEVPVRILEADDRTTAEMALFTINALNAFSSVSPSPALSPLTDGFSASDSVEA